MNTASIPRSILLSLVFAAILAACSSGGPAEVPGNADEVRPLLPGMKAPVFTITDAGGKAYAFDPENLKKRTIVTFYRGGWCPYCSRYYQRLRLIEPDLLDMNYDLLFLSADSPETLAPSMEDNEYEYKVLSDNELTAAKAFGVAFQLDDETFAKYGEHGHDLEGASGRAHHMLPVPSMFLIGSDGVIRYQYVNPNYKIRLDPSVLLELAYSVYAEETGEE